MIYISPINGPFVPISPSYDVNQVLFSDILK